MKGLLSIWFSLVATISLASTPQTLFELYIAKNGAPFTYTSNFSTSLTTPNGVIDLPTINVSYQDVDVTNQAVMNDLVSGLPFTLRMEDNIRNIPTLLFETGGDQEYSQIVNVSSFSGWRLTNVLASFNGFDTSPVDSYVCTEYEFLGVPVPEPSTFVLWLIGLVCWLLFTGPIVAAIVVCWNTAVGRRLQ